MGEQRLICPFRLNEGDPFCLRLIEMMGVAVVVVVLKMGRFESKDSECAS
jgi:hypothetical protein